MELITMVAWLMIMSHGVEDDGTHNYYLHKQGYHINVSGKELPYSKGQRVKFRLKMTCSEVNTNIDRERFCNALKWEVIQ